MLLIPALVACTGQAPEPAAAPAPAPVTPASWLIIVADDLGTDKVGAYGEHESAPPTPNLDRLAAQGVLFRNAYTSPTCSASRSALLTGRYGRRTGMGGIVELDESTWELPLSEVLLPELLDRGEIPWSTAAVGKWHLSGHRTEHAFHHPNLQGFDHYAGVLGNLVLTSKDYGQKGSYTSFEKATNGQVEFVRRRYVTVDTTDDAIAQLGTLEPPWLLYVAYNAPHVPYHAPPPELVSGPALPRDALDRRKFAATVEAMDREIGRLLGALTDEQRARTNVLFIGDNGTERSAVLPPRRPDQAKGTLYEGGINVPLLVAGPDAARGAEAWALVHSVDVLPTIAELAGIDTSGLVLDGLSFAEVLRDPTSDGARHTVFSERFKPLGLGPYDTDLVAIRDDRYKLLQTGRGARRFTFHDLQGRFDDGPGQDPASLRGAEKERYHALLAELEATLERLGSSL